MDVIQGKGPHPAFVLRLVQGLPDTSLSMALASGGKDHYGWSADRHLLADIYEAINTNTRATGNWKGKPPTFPTWPRPTSRKRSRSKPKTLADLYRRFAGKMG